MREIDAETFNDFLYWRRPPINLDGAAPIAEEEEHPDYMRWRRRPGNLVGSLFSRGEPLDGHGAPRTADQSASVSTVSSPDPYSGQPEDDGEHTLVDIEGHHDHTTLVDMELELKLGLELGLGLALGLGLNLRLLCCRLSAAVWTRTSAP